MGAPLLSDTLPENSATCPLTHESDAPYALPPNRLLMIRTLDELLRGQYSVYAPPARRLPEISTLLFCGSFSSHMMIADVPPGSGDRIVLWVNVMFDAPWLNCAPSV